MSSTALTAPAADAEVLRQAARRRTFAIISHPDAGKTTLTEKLLLYAGAIELAGSVRSKAQQRHARSDWLEMEQARGISVTSTVLQFERDGLCFNLLDTPGHQDFSEDTYRVLTAVDGAVMVIDAAKGVEPQTRKLFAVCKQRGIPILTFVNKLDLPGRDPLDLLDEIEGVLGMAAIPFDCPMGTGSDFRGVFDLRNSRVLRFERVAGGQRPAPTTVSGLDDPELVALMGAEAHARFREETELLGALGHFDLEAYRAGRQTPVFFGSALNNFGVETFLQAIGELAPPPSARASASGPIVPGRPEFTGFVFKIQANMDRQHRDSMAFVRVVSGHFRKGMSVHHGRLDRRVRLPRAHRVFAQERESTEEAFPGDVVGLVNPGLFAIGDTISEHGPLQFEAMPHFPPEHFARLSPVTTDKHKAFTKGLRQLEEEGAIQVLYATHAAARRDPILAAVGELQFDLVRARLSAEYGVETRLDRLQHRLSMTVDEDAPDTMGSLRTKGTRGETVMLFESDWAVRHFREQLDAQRAGAAPGATAVAP
ncbi:MAG: peptide chain release factor 3 [Vicinamibacteria bacterium]|nr:peptide chain release factor 3 [Vicinamibacteria bacterium]